MSEPSDAAGTRAALGPAEEAAASPPSLTRGFLFADLRGYTRFVETHGATTAAELLVRYRALVRDAIGRYRGTEIGTEGDSFFVVFPAVSSAVQCGLAITEGARQETSAAPGAQGIKVGVGIHAGETVDTPDGFVGSAVNIAARICAIAAPGQVLVSDTVRALTQSVVPVAFAAVGRRQLKGVREPLMLYVAAPADPVATARVARRQRSLRVARWVALGAVIAILAAGAYWWQNRPAAALPPGPWTIGLDLPLTGDSASGGMLVRDAVQLAIDDVKAAGGIGGSELVLDVRDDLQDPGTGVDNVKAFIADPKVVAMIGPWGSNPAVAEIPLTNAAGLLQCSPSNTRPQLTKPRDGALDLRAAHPDRINYIRTAPADDIQGPALASFVFRDLIVKFTLVVDDGDFGRDIADRFSEAYQKLGGSVVRRTLNPGADPATVLQPLSGADAATAVFFGGFTDTGAVDLRLAMMAAGKAAVPFVSWDDGRVFDRWNRHAFDASFLQLAGPAAEGSYFSHAAVALPKADFVERYRARFGGEPDEYSGAAYACAQVIFESLRGVAATGPSATSLREAVRAYAVDTSHRYETVIGTVGFDANGDSLQQFVTFYRVDPSAAGGKGDWVIDKQQDYGPAP